MILGTGVDITEVERIRRALENPRSGERFRSRVFTDAERAYCEGRRRRYESYAARFAAKEAVLKALGTGWSGSVGWREIEVATGPEGRPRIVLHGNARAVADRLGISSLHLSLSHTSQCAVAQVIAEGEGRGKRP